MAALPREQIDFLQVLVNVVGMNNNQAQAVAANGILDMGDLADIDEDSALDIHRGNARLTAMTKSRFKAFMNWCFDQIQLNPPPPLPGVNNFDNTRSVEAIHSRNRHVNRVHLTTIAATAQTNDEDSGQYRMESDSRADTTCFGRGWTIEYHTGEVVDVDGFHESFHTLKDVSIATASTAFDHPDGNTYVLTVNEGLDFTATMEHSLLPPAQVWHNKLICDVVPKHCCNGKSIFGIYDAVSDVHLPFNLHGCISYLPICKPTEHELEHCARIILTSDQPWRPYSTSFANQEKPYNNLVTDAIDEETLYQAYDFAGNRVICATSTKDHRSTVDAPTLARRWGTSIPVAEKTLKITTQHGACFVSNGLTRRFRTRQA